MCGVLRLSHRVSREMLRSLRDIVLVLYSAWREEGGAENNHGVRYRPRICVAIQSDFVCIVYFCVCYPK